MTEQDDVGTESEHWSPRNPWSWDGYQPSHESSVESFPVQSPPQIDEPTNWYRTPEPLPELTPEASARVAKLLGEILGAHGDVSAKRYRIREMRHMLRQKRCEEDDVRTALRRNLNLLTADNVQDNLAAINHTIDKLQGVTASYFILENEYQRQENELAKLEHDYNSRLERLQTIFKQSNSLAEFQAIHSETDTTSSDYSSEYADEVSSQMAEYLSMVEETRILFERLSDIETEYLMLVDQCNLRERAGIPLESGARNSLLRYPEEKSKIESELELARHKLESHPEHGNYFARRAEEEYSEEEVLQRFLPEEPDNPLYADPLRSSEVDDPSPFFASPHSQPVNKGTFVNRWLLHRLRHSRVEIMRFKSAPELVDLDSKGWGSDNISRMAMKLWFQDDEPNLEHIRSQSGK
jgi:hypothetical protein